MKTIGERIVFLREELEMSQKELAARIGIPPTSLSRYENNQYEPKAEILKRLALALQTSSDFLLGMTDDFKRFSESEPVGLTAEEQRLITQYRKLSDENKIRLHERTLSLLDMQKMFVV